MGTRRGAIGGARFLCAKSIYIRMSTMRAPSPRFIDNSRRNQISPTSLRLQAGQRVRMVKVCTSCSTRRHFSYAEFYNKLYSHSSAGSKEACNSYIFRLLNNDGCIRCKHAVATNVMRLRTQTIAEKLDSQVFLDALHLHRQCDVSRRIRLRPLQRRIINHLWRPTSGLTTRRLQGCLHDIFRK